MTTNFLQAPGDEIVSSDLVIQKARDAVRLIEKIPFFNLIGVKKTDNKDEVVIFEADIEVGQRTIHDVRSVERLAIVFTCSDDAFPEVLALRDNFPKVPHLNLRFQEKPRSLCLYEVKFSESKLRWSTVEFLERIRQWLSLTAKGELHAVDQPLEPLIASSFHLIIPHNLFQTIDENRNLLFVRRVECGDGKVTLIAQRFEDTPASKGEVPYVAAFVITSPVVHGVINNQPQNLSELHDILSLAGTDLLAILRKLLPDLKNDPSWNLLKANLILIVNIPKLRTQGAEPEANEMWAFLMPQPLDKIGIEIGIWKIFDNILASMEIAPDLTKNGSNITVIPVNPIKTLSKESASNISGLPEHINKKFLIAGVGALGSQLFMHLIRMGVGTWVTVDDDCLLPHNVSRHALDGRFIGASKAEALSEIANCCLDGKGNTRFITADILSPGKNKEVLEAAYKEADIIIDATTSVPAARQIACDVESNARRMSVFLNPAGCDSVLLTEDVARKFPLDLLEMQYYRFLLDTPELHNHLQRHDGSIRYGRSCRDISFILAQEMVGLHSAICARGIRKALESTNAAIALWRHNDEGAVVKYTVEPCEVYRRTFDDWTLCYDSALIDKIKRARTQRLPNETGGILLGTFDLQRKIVYVIDTILSPPDSEEWPTIYIRGCTGLKSEVDRVKKITMGMLDYVGEWHSHPGYGTRPSGDDLLAFEWLVEIMDVCGQPALMSIVGEENLSWYLGKML